jgi:branched-chain amino acid transport system ATP-binding protein
MAPVLEIDRVRAGYAYTPVLRNLSLTVGQGQVVAILGPNGAGKTTLLRTVSGVIRPTVGRIVLDGTDITRMATNKIVAAGVAQSPEGRRMFPHMSAEANLRVGAYTRKDRGQIDADIDDFFELWPVVGRRRKSPAGLLSGGEQQIVALGRALLARPKVLLLDEPSLGLAPVLVSAVYDGLRKMVAERSQSVLLVEQNAKQALKLADVVNVLVGGQIVFSGPADAVTASDVADMYFASAAKGAHA